MNDPRDQNPTPPSSSISRRSALGAGLAGAATVFGFSRAVSAQSDPSTWVIQTASFKLNPDKADEGIEAIRGLTEAVEANEPGVLVYMAHRSKNDPTQLFFYEIYADQEALAAHGQTEHIGALRTLFTTGVLQPPVEIVPMESIGGYKR